MSLYGLASSNGSQEYQYTACAYGIKTHPYYHKCDDCAYTDTCDIRKNMLDYESHKKLLADLEKWQEEQKQNSRILNPKRLP